MTNFEPILQSLLQKKIDGSPRLIPPPLLRAIEYSLLAPGKRIRPQLVYATAQLFKLPTEAVDRLAATVEMLHCFTLIHDDLPCLDDDDERRGRPANHIAFDEATALLAGDALTLIPFEVLSEIKEIAPENVLRCIGRVAHSLTGVVGGQTLELSVADKPTLKATQEIHYLKTALLFECCVLATADLAGATHDQIESLQSFSKTLGLAFQAQDDLQDQESQEPTSLLYFQNAETIRALAKVELKKAADELQNKWGEPALELLKIAQKVNTYL